jgi:hypothetical protein
MQHFEPPDTFHLEAAHGWLELGNHIEADKELDRITPQLRVHPDVLDIRWQIDARAKKWDACVDTRPDTATSLPSYCLRSGNRLVRLQNTTAVNGVSGYRSSKFR